MYAAITIIQPVRFIIKPTLRPNKTIAATATTPMIVAGRTFIPPLFVISP